MEQSKKGSTPPDPYAFPGDFEEPLASGKNDDIVKSKDINEDMPASTPISTASSSSKTANLTAIPASSASDIEESVKAGSSSAQKPSPTTGKSASAPMDLLKKIDKDSEMASSPLGSPLTPDSVDNAGTDHSEREGSPAGRPKSTKSRRSRTNTLDTDSSASKRKSVAGEFGPGSPQTIMSERRQLALLRQQARDNDKQMSPDTSFTRDGPSTPSSTSSTKESRSANRRDGKGETPLHIACKKGDLAAAKRLLDDGADVNAADNAGWTPLHEAANHGREDVTRLLLKSCADHTARAFDGRTPLMDAVINGHVSIAEILLKSGADAKCENDHGQTCLDLCDELEVFQTLFQPYLKDQPVKSRSASVSSRKSKSDTVNTEKDSRSRTASVNKKESEPIEAKSLDSSPKPLTGMPIKAAPSVVTVSAGLDYKTKETVESQYEDISDDEAEPAAAGGVIQPNTVAPAVASLTLALPRPVEIPPNTASPPAPVPAAAVAVITPSPIMLPVPVMAATVAPSKPTIIPRLRPPSPVPPPVQAAPAVVPVAAVSPTVTPPPSMAIPTLIPHLSVEKSDSEPNTNANVTEKTGDESQRDGTQMAGVVVAAEPAKAANEPVISVTPAVVVPVREASVVPPSEQIVLPPAAAAVKISISPVSEAEKLSQENTVVVPEAKSPSSVPPVTPLSESPVQSADTAVSESKTSLVTAATPAVTPEAALQVSTVDLAAGATSTPSPEPPPVHATTTIPITENPVATSGTVPTLPNRTSPTVLVQPIPRMPTLSLKMPPTTPPVSSPVTTVSVTSSPVTVVSTPSPVISKPSTPGPVEKKEKKSERPKEKDIPVKVTAPSFLPQGPPLMLTVKRPAKDSGKDGGDDGKELAGPRSGDAVTPSASAGETTEQPPPVKAKAGESSSKTAEPPAKKQKEDKPVKPMTRAQRAQAAQATSQSAGPGKKRKEKDEKHQRVGRPSKRAAADADIQSGEDAGGLDTKLKRAGPSRMAPKKLKPNKEEPSPAKASVVEPPKSPMELMTESPARLPFKKRLGIRNEIEEFINQRRQVEDNWKKYSNNFAMKIFPKHCSDYLIMRKNYSLDASLPKKLDAPLALPPALKDFWLEQAEERTKLTRAHMIERDRLIMGAEQETMRLHQRFSRISAGITIPYSACMIISEQESNRSFQNQEQEERTRNASRNRTSPRDLIKWLEESDDKFDYAKKELLTRHRLEAAMLRSKQRLDWAWKASDLNMVDPSCRNPEELPNLYVPEVVVEDFILLPDQ